MFKHLTRYGGAILVLLAVVVRPAAGSEVSVTFRDGKVTVIARDATLRQLLAEWQRVGHTRIEPLDRVPALPITIELVDVPQSQALAMILRSLSGYIAARRMATVAGESMYDRVLLTPTLAQASPAVASSTPPRPAQTVPDYMRNGMPGAFPGPIPGNLGGGDSDASSDDDVQDGVPQPLVRPGLPMNRRPGGVPVTGMVGVAMPDPSGQPIDPIRQGLPATGPVNGPLTAPMPGMLIPGPSPNPPKGPGGIPPIPPRPPGDPRS